MFDRKLMNYINPESLSTKKVGEHIPSGFSMSTIFSFKS